MERNDAAFARRPFRMSINGWVATVSFFRQKVERFAARTSWHIARARLPTPPAIRSQNLCRRIVCMTGSGLRRIEWIIEHGGIAEQNIQLDQHQFANGNRARSITTLASTATSELAGAAGIVEFHELVIE